MAWIRILKGSLVKKNHEICSALRLQSLACLHISASTISRFMGVRNKLFLIISSSDYSSLGERPGRKVVKLNTMLLGMQALINIETLTPVAS